MDNVEIIDFNFDLLPIDSDFMSLQMDSYLKGMYLESEFYIYNQVAESI